MVLKASSLPRHDDVVTTGYVARLMKVAPRTVAKWFDEGLIKGYKLPNSQDRRIHLADLMAFMLGRGMFRDIGAVKLSGPYGLHEGRVTMRDGVAVVRVGASEAKPADGHDLRPGDESDWELKSADDGVVVELSKAGYRFVDGR